MLLSGPRRFVGLVGVRGAGLGAVAALVPGLLSALVWVSGAAASLTAGAGSDPLVNLTSVSCASAGNCSAVGSYVYSDSRQGLLLSQTGGKWSAGVKATLPTGARSHAVNVNSVSCWAAGNCSAVGAYTDSSHHRQGLLLSETHDRWVRGMQAILPNGVGSNSGVTLRAVTCPSAGNCNAVGSYTDSSGSTQGLLLSETGGGWARGVKAALPASAGSNPKVFLASLSCASVGNCSAVGSYTDISHHRQGLLLSETHGRWARAKEATLPADAGTSPSVSLLSVSCASAGNCRAVGHYTDRSDGRQGLLLTETAGGWARGVEATPPAGAIYVSPTSVSCASAGNCNAVGLYTDSSLEDAQGLLVTQSGGKWSAGKEATLPSDAGSTAWVILKSVSCASAGNCSAVGSYRNSSFGQQGLLLSDTGGSWAAAGSAVPNRDVTLAAVSCSSVGNCSAVGSYVVGGLLVTETHGTWSAGKQATLPPRPH